MRRPSATAIVLKVLGLLLLTAAVLKGHELLTVPVGNRDFWSWRPFLICQVEFELALGLWLVSGVCQPLAWLAGVACFGLFCGVTLHQVLKGDASCGCFGVVRVPPWVTLLAVDVPALVMLARFPPPGALDTLVSCLRRLASALTGGQGSVRPAVVPFAPPLWPRRRLVAMMALVLTVLGITTPILALREPPKVTAAYEVLEPETWIGRELPILKYIDIADQLENGTWIIIFYHYDCPGCARVIPAYEQIAQDLAGREGLPRIALIAVPPWGRGPVRENSPCTLGRLARIKHWFITTPAFALLSNGLVTFAWEKEAPDLETLLQNAAQRQRAMADTPFSSTALCADASKKGGEYHDRRMG
jgi:hypothetical protein